MAKLVSIQPENQAPDVIATLEHALERARSGMVSSVAIAFVYRDGRLGHDWSTIPSTGMLLGSVQRLAYKLNCSFDHFPPGDPAG